MTPPITMCITTEEREKAGYRSFRQWIEDPKNVYIGSNVQKYLKNSTPSNSRGNWIPPPHDPGAMWRWRCGGMWRGVGECWGVLLSVGECVVACVG